MTHINKGNEKCVIQPYGSFNLIVHTLPHMSKLHAKNVYYNCQTTFEEHPFCLFVSLMHTHTQARHPRR